MTESRSGRCAALVIGLLFAVSLALQWYVVATHRIPVSADQAVVGLMARHILAGKGHPVFYYGAAYAGSLEPHYVAAAFAILGASPASYRAAMALLVLLLMLGVYLTTRRVFGERAGLFALAYLAIPPFFFLYKGLTSDGSYDSFNLLTLATVATALGIDSSGSRRRAVALWSLLGLFIGLAWWVTPLATVISAVTLAWLLWRRESRPFPQGLLALALGALAGSFPWWIWNLRHGWASLRAAELGVSGPARVVPNLFGVLWSTLPTLAGGMEATPNVILSRPVFPFSRATALLLLLLLFAVTLRRLDRSRTLLLSLFAVLVVVSAFSARLVLSEPRFLFPYYVLVPPLAGVALTERKRRKGAWLGVAPFGVALALNVASLLAAPVNLRLNDNEVTGSLDPLIAGLERAGLRHVYTDYWTAYRLSFESGERIIATPIPGDQLVRYAPYLEEVNGAPDAAVVLLPPRDGCFGAYLREKEMPFDRAAVGNFGIYSGLPTEALRSIRSGTGLPLPRDAYRVSWRLGPQLRELPAGSSRRVPVTVRNDGPCIWAINVHLGYHWRPEEPGLPALFDNPRAFPPGPLYPGAAETFTIDLVAPASPGRYSLEYDLVNENVDWFSTKGGRTPAIEVQVLPVAGSAGGESRPSR